MIQIVKARIHSTREFWSEIMIALFFQKVLCDLEVFLKREQKWGMLFSNSSPGRHHFLKYGPFASVSHTGRKPCCNSVLLPFLCRSQSKWSCASPAPVRSKQLEGFTSKWTQSAPCRLPPRPRTDWASACRGFHCRPPYGQEVETGWRRGCGPKIWGWNYGYIFFFFIETSLTHSVGFCRAEFHASGMWGVGGFQGLA